MPRALPPIPSNTPIADGKDGTITTFFRLRWQELVDGWAQSGTIGSFVPPGGGGLTGALGTTSVYTTSATGLYRVSWYLRKTRADGVASSATLTLGWVDRDAQPLTFVAPALTLDSVTAVQSGVILCRALQSSDITAAVAYSSTTAGQMRYDLEVRVEQLA